MMLKYFIVFICIFISNSKILAQSYNVVSIFPYSNNKLVEKNEKYGLINENENVIVEAKYDKISDNVFGSIYVELDNKMGFLNKEGKELIPIIYDIDTKFFIGASKLHVLEQNSHDNEFKANIIFEIRECFKVFSEDIVVVIKNGKYGFINTKNKVIIDFKFDGADNFSNGIAIVKIDNKYGAINKKGKVIIPLKYDLLVWDERGRNTIYAKINGDCLYINAQEKKVADCK